MVELTSNDDLETVLEGSQVGLGSGIIVVVNYPGRATKKKVQRLSRLCQAIGCDIWFYWRWNQRRWTKLLKYRVAMATIYRNGQEIDAFPISQVYCIRKTVRKYGMIGP
jgi:hypothetical protein